MYTPTSTYRIQVNETFRLSDVAGIVDYLHRLGISTIYSAPFFQARAGSTHGYDVTNPQVISSEIGTTTELQAIAGRLKEKNMGWLQDIVPNHMAFDSANLWLTDIFEKGKHSTYYRFFDIDWDYPEAGWTGKVIAPFLGGPLEEVVQKGEVQLQYNQRGFSIQYYSLEYPVSWPSYDTILAYGMDFLEAQAESAETVQSFRHLLEDFKSLSLGFDTSFDTHGAPQLKEQLYQLYTSSSIGKQIIDYCLETINRDPSAMLALLDRQFFRLDYWRTTEREINYRRFFTVNDLICLRMEDEPVFEQYHQFIKTLLDQGLIQGLRIDHIDGLYNPTGYLEKLRSLVGENVYVIVEKILESEEELPKHWPVEGTSGYEFLSEVNRLLTDDRNKDRLSEIYQHFIRTSPSYEDLVFEKKLFILKENMGGELNNLLSRMRPNEITAIQPNAAGEHFKEALAVWLASFSVYRVYPTQFPLNEVDANVVEASFTSAEKRAPQLKEALQTIHALFEGSGGDEALRLVMRIQQFTGPLAAKGVEDTVFYLYNRLISHNEVGDSPHLVGTSAEAFHRRMQERLKNTPLSINATATHDTKRGEDARLRINVLSELPEEWQAAVFEWKEINEKHKRREGEKVTPDENDEYFIYQTLIGGFPMEGTADDTFQTRLTEYMIKVVREAKAHTNWSEPNEAYEKGVMAFIESILQDEEFLQAFRPFFGKVRQYGMLYSLAQTVLKTTAPGIPDVYQGCELWDLSFVDPDNRREVDFGLRQRYLDEIDDRLHRERDPFMQELVRSGHDGRIKLLCLYQALNARKQMPDLFAQGDYLPLTLTGNYKDHAVAFARKIANQWALVVVPKNIASISTVEQMGMGESVWGNTAVLLPEDAPEAWKNQLTDRRYQARATEVSRYAATETYAGHAGNVGGSNRQLPLREILEVFPVALLMNNDE
jgi:(1->4)-alpha-D-glucan 1-alpha-D-glucosylmutase